MAPEGLREPALDQAGFDKRRAARVHAAPRSRALWHRIAALLFVGHGLALVPHAPALALAAPNVVVIDANLVTSGQPSADALAQLSAEGFQAVLYLAPFTVSDAVKEEPQIVGRQGMEFIHVPIPFGAPTEAHFEAVAAALDRLKDKKVLVHCQVNMRASSMVFLYRVLQRREAPALAYDAVTRVWSPQGPWKKLVQQLLEKRGIAFELF